LRNSTLAILFMLMSLSCASVANNGLMNWLVGDWEAQDGAITEHWRAVSADTLEGKGVTTSKDKVSTETLRLVRMEGEIYFIAKVAHNEYPVAFHMTDASTADRVVFANPTHDFPKQIVYQRDGPDRLIVTVSDGGSEGFEIRFSRR